MLAVKITREPPAHADIAIIIDDLAEKIPHGPMMPCGAKTIAG